MSCIRHSARAKGNPFSLRLNSPWCASTQHNVGVAFIENQHEGHTSGLLGPLERGRSQPWITRLNLRWAAGWDELGERVIINYLNRLDLKRLLREARLNIGNGCRGR